MVTEQLADDVTMDVDVRFDPDGEPQRYIYERLAAHLAGLIRSGKLKPKSLLPAEQRLADGCGVSLGTARHATRLLREQGLIVTVRSKGSFVCDVSAWKDS